MTYTRITDPSMRAAPNYVTPELAKWAAEHIDEGCMNIAGKHITPEYRKVLTELGNQLAKVTEAP